MKIIYLDIHEANPSNVYKVDVLLLGDAKSTRGVMISIIKENLSRNPGLVYQESNDYLKLKIISNPYQE